MLLQDGSLEFKNMESGVDYSRFGRDALVLRFSLFFCYFIVAYNKVDRYAKSEASGMACRKLVGNEGKHTCYFNATDLHDVCNAEFRILRQFFL